MKSALVAETEKPSTTWFRSRLSAGTALVLLCTSLAGPALANGGVGGGAFDTGDGSAAGGNGGADNPSTPGTAGAAGSSILGGASGGGGGGAGAGTGGAGGGGVSNPAGTSGSGGAGGAHGEVGAGLPAGGTPGGDGGDGGNGVYSVGAVNIGGGGGGAGGYGAVVTGTGASGTLSGVVRGGRGGDGGNAAAAGSSGDRGFGSGGSGGSGGTGLFFTSGSANLTVTGTVRGADGGAAGASGPASSGASAGAGGEGIVGSSLTIVTSGTIAGGMSGDGASQAAALHFTGGFNKLTFLNASTGLSGGIVIDTGATLIFDQPTTVTVGNVISGGGSVIKQDSGTLIISGANTYTGGTTISGGVLQIGDGGTSGAIIGDVLNNSALIFNRSDDIVFAGAISGSGDLQKIGAGSLTLNGANTYSGGTTINAGTLALSGAGSLAATGALNLAASGAEFDISAASGDRTIGALSGVAGSTIALGANTLTFGDSTNQVFAGSIGGSGAVVKQGTGTQTLTGANTYTGGTTIAAGTLALGAGGSLAATGSVDLASGTTFSISAAGSQTIGGLAGGPGSVVLGSNTLTIDSAAHTTFLGAIVGSGGLVKQGAGTQTLAGVNAFTGNVTINAGTLALSGGGRLVSGAALSLAGAGSGFDISTAASSPVLGSFSGVTGSTVTLGANTLTFGDATNQVFAGSIGGTGGIVKQGTGRQTLSGPSSYSGTTTVSAGELRVDGALTGLGAVTVAAGATLSGTGSIAGAVTVNGTLSAGHSPGTLTVGSLTLNSGSTSIFELNTPGVVGGSNPITGNDLVEVTGNLRLGGALDARAAAAGYYRLFDYGGTLTGSFDSQSVTSTRGGFTVASAQLDTTVTGQVNLVVLGTGQTMQFWDGANTSGNGTVDGGGGTWSNFGSNWTNSAGSANAGWGGSVGIFAGAAGGAVSVSGTVSFDTLQFSTNGYVLSGGTLSIAPASGAAGTFNVDNGVVASIASTIADGSGTAVVKVGGGTLILSGNNSYTGGTAIDGGVLQISADANLGAASGSLSLDGGTLRTTASFSSARNVVINAAGGIFRTDADLAWSGVLSGSGALTKTGNGMLTLTGTNTYAGGTSVTAGVLQIGDGGTSGSITGAVVNNSTLAFNRSDDIAFAGAISGTGDVQKRGAGSLTLTGTNTYSGGTLIAQGTLIGSASSFGVSQIMNNGTLVVVQPTDASFANMINGTGSFTKRGAGNLSLTGTSALVGSTTVEAGKLSVNGSLASSAVTVLSGATLGGSGTVGGIVANAGATVAPGNSIGTLTVSGNVSFASSSVYRVEVDAAGQGDRIAASGSAAIWGGVVDVLAATGNYAASTSYTILTASGGISGRFADVTSNLAFLTPSLSYGGTSVTLTMTRNDTGFGPGGGDTDGGNSGGTGAGGNYIAQTRNQGFIASAAEALGAGNPVYDTLLSGTAQQARAGFDLLSGEAHAQAVSVMIDESRLVREAILNRLRGPLLTPAPGQVATAFSADLPGRKGAVVMAAPVPQPRYVVWGEAFGSTGNSNADGNAAGMSRRSGGALLGADVMLYDAPGSSLKVGVAGGYSQSRFDLDARLSTGKLESGHAALYAGARFGQLRFDAGAAYSWSESDIRRQVQIRGFGDALRLQRPGSVAQAFAELGYGFAFSGFALEPFAQLALIRVSTEAGIERGGAAALRVLSSEQTLGFSTLGLRVEAQIGTAPLFARAMLGWRHGFGELTPQAKTAFATGTTAARVFAAPIDREALVAEAGLDWRISSATALGLTYSAAIGERSRDHALKGRVEMRF